MSSVVPAAVALLVAVCSSHCALTGLLTGQGNRGRLLLLCQLMQIYIHPGHARQLPLAFLIPACTPGMSALTWLPQPWLDRLLTKHVQVYIHSDHILVGMCRDVQGRAGQGRAGQGRAGQGRAGQGRAGQGRAGQGKVEQGRSRSRAGQHGLPRPEHIWSNDGLRHNFILLSIMAMPCDISQSN